MKITVEIEPVLCSGNLSDKEYYGFRIVGGPLDKCVFESPIYATSDARYPGNDAMREFFNRKIQEAASCQPANNTHQS